MQPEHFLESRDPRDPPSLALSPSINAARALGPWLSRLHLSLLETPGSGRSFGEVQHTTLPG